MCARRILQKKIRFILFCWSVTVECLTFNFSPRSLSIWHKSLLRCRFVQSYDNVLALFALESTNDQSIDTAHNKTDIRARGVKFVAPLLQYGYRPAVEEYENLTLSNKPLLLYLPGFDGTFLSPFLQYPELHTIFDIRCMTVTQNDRSTLDELQNDVIHYLGLLCSNNVTLSNSNSTTEIFNITKGSKNISKEKTLVNGQRRRRPIYIAGESFGSILAIMVAIKLIQEPSSNFCLKGLTLINSATSYDRSRLVIEGPKVAHLNKWIYPFGLISSFLPLFTDKYSIEQLLLILQSKALPSIIDNPCREAYMGRVAFSLPFVVPFMPKETLQWRLSSWLDTGCARLATPDKPLKKLQNLPILIIAGENDATLPSIAEAERLASIFKNSFIHVVEGAGHASTCGSRVDLAALFRFRFDELRASTPKQSNNPFIFWDQSTKPSEHDELNNRIAMKKTAATGKGIYFGMEPRYDNAKVGLSPLSYWSKGYYKKVDAQQIP